MRLKANTIIIVVFAVTILHFIVTSIAEHYIATQVGSLTGQVTAEGLIEASEKPHSSGKDMNKIYQKMKAESNEELSKWKIPSFLISLPIKPVLNPLRKMIVETWIAEPVRDRQISLEQVKSRARIIDNVANGLNSILLGILIYLVYRFILKARSR